MILSEAMQLPRPETKPGMIAEPGIGNFFSVMKFYNCTQTLLVCVIAAKPCKPISRP